MDLDKDTDIELVEVLNIDLYKNIENDIKKVMQKSTGKDFDQHIERFTEHIRDTDKEKMTICLWVGRSYLTNLQLKSL